MYLDPRNRKLGNTVSVTFEFINYIFVRIVKQKKYATRPLYKKKRN